MPINRYVNENRPLSLVAQPPRKRQTQKPGTRVLLTRSGWTMLVLVAARLFTALLPYRLLAPEWYLSAGLELVNCSPVLLTAPCVRKEVHPV